LSHYIWFVKMILVNSVLVVFIIQVLVFWLLFVKSNSRFKYYFNFNNRFIVKNFKVADIGKLANEIKPKPTEKIEIKNNEKEPPNSNFDHEIDFDLPEMEANTDDGTAPTEIEDRINKELGSGGISKGETVQETAELVEYETFTRSIPSQMNVLYRLVYESMTAGYLNVEGIDTEEKLDREVDYYMEEYQNMDASIDFNILVILRSELRKNFIPFLRQFIVIYLNSVDEINAKTKEKERLRKKAKPFDEKTYQDLMNIHNKISTKNKESDAAK
jgi:hypothetical protein